MNKEYLDIFVEQLCKKYHGNLLNYFEENPFNNIQKEYKEVCDEYESHEVSQYILPTDRMTEDKWFTFKYIESGEEVSEELNTRLNYLFKRQRELQNENFILNSDIIEFDGISCTVSEFIDSVKNESIKRFTYFDFYNGLEVVYNNKCSKISFYSPRSDELYSRAEKVLDVDLTNLDNNTNEVFNDIKSLTDDELREYDYTKLIESLSNDTDINIISTLRYLTDKNVSFTYKKYPEFKQIVDKTSAVLRIWRVKV
jgi:ribosomal protein S8